MVASARGGGGDRDGGERSTCHRCIQKTIDRVRIVEEPRGKGHVRHVLESRGDVILLDDEVNCRTARWLDEVDPVGGGGWRGVVEPAQVDHCVVRIADSAWIGEAEISPELTSGDGLEGGTETLEVDQVSCGDAGGCQLNGTGGVVEGGCRTVEQGDGVVGRPVGDEVLRDRDLRRRGGDRVGAQDRPGLEGRETAGEANR